MSRRILPGQPLRLKANEVTQALRAGEQFDALRLGTGVHVGPPLRVSLFVTVKHAGTASLPAYGLTRWAGPAMEPAAVGGDVPDLVLRTTEDTDAQCGVVVDEILAADAEADPPRPAGIGVVAISGVAWCRARGPIEAGDYLEPDDEYYAVRDISGDSSCQALQAVGYAQEAIVPVLLLNRRVVGRCNAWRLDAAGDPATDTGGTISFALRVDSVTETVTLSCPSTLVQTRDALAVHSRLAPGDVVVTCGTLPGVGQRVVFRVQVNSISLVENLLDRTWTARPSYYWTPP